MSDADRWAVVERIYHDATDRPLGERAAFLQSACAGDDTLRREVESLLANDGGSLLDKSALEVAARDMTQQETPSWIGRTIRNYDVVALLGVGGMGEVYRARDQSLGREVALKFLSREVSTDPEKLRRLEREARMLAALNHPNIATLFGLEEHAGQRFLVMELVPGQTLGDRLRGGALPIREALGISCQIAEGLETAHEAGIIHRDLKPANIKVAPDGRVKILDFGLAKALDVRERNAEPTFAASDATREGTILGTPAYMSPEQARGQPVDRRTDVWAFGCCLYEALTGRSAFKGRTVTDILAAVVDKDPDWTALREGVPDALHRLLRRLLAKDVRQRLQHIGDARLELKEIMSGAADRPAETKRRIRGVPALTAVIVASVGALAVWPYLPRSSALTHRGAPHLTLKIEGDGLEGLRLPVAAFYTPFALSPDGERLVFRARGGGTSQLFLRELSTFETRPLPGTDAAAAPFFSPDGRWIAFWRAEDRILRKIPVAGGSPIVIAPTDVPHDVLWTTNDEIVIQNGDPNGQLWSVPAGGGTPKPIAIPDRLAGELILPRARVPGSNDLLVAITDADGTWLGVLSRETGKRRHLLRRAGNGIAAFTRTGHLLYSDGDSLVAVPVNDRFEPAGDPTPVLQGIDHYSWKTNVALSENGTVIYLPADRVREAELLWLDREGNATPVPGGRAPFASVALSPDGREAAGELVEDRSVQVWIFDLARGAKRLLVSEGESRQPIWSRDGQFVTYLSSRGDGQAILRKHADGTGNPELLTRRSGWTILEDWSPDGRSLLFCELTSRGDSDVWIYSAGKATPLIASPFSEASARFSPDGRFVAFDADDGGVSHVYVQPFPGPGPRTAISADEAAAPEWIEGGRQLFYRSSRRMMVVDVQTRPVLRVGQPRPLNERRDPWGKITPAPDSRHFLTLSPRTAEGPIELRILLNWFDELERLAPHPRS